MAFKMNKFSGFKNADDNKRRLKEVKSSIREEINRLKIGKNK